MTTKQKNEEYQATLTAQMEEVKGLLIKANERAEDQARTITKLNQDALQARKQQDGEGIAWEANSSKNYDYFGTRTGHSGPLMPDNDAENGRYDDVVVNKGHSLDDGDKQTHERGV